MHMQAGVNILAANELMLEDCRQYKQVLCVVSATEHFRGCSLSNTFQAHINMSGEISQSTGDRLLPVAAPARRHQYVWGHAAQLPASLLAANLAAICPSLHQLLGLEG